METEEREVWENLAEWDNLENPLAPLTEEQQKTIIELAALCDHKLTAQDVSLLLFPHAVLFNVFHVTNVS